MEKYMNMTSKELKQLGKEKKVKNWWTLNKAQLAEALVALEPKVEEKKEEKKPRAKRSTLKVVYAEKDGNIFIIKDNGTIWGLWYKYNAQGYKNIMAFEYDKCFGEGINTNNRTMKKYEFIKKYGNPDLTIETQTIWSKQKIKNRLSELDLLIARESNQVAYEELKVEKLHLLEILNK